MKTSQKRNQQQLKIISIEKNRLKTKKKIMTNPKCKILAYQKLIEEFQAGEHYFDSFIYIIMVNP